MKPIIFLIMLIAFSKQSNAQDSLAGKQPLKRVFFKATVYFNNLMMAEDHLVQIVDSSMILSFSPQPFNSSPIAGNSKTIPFSQIDYVDIRRRNSVGRGAIGGFIIGAATGALAGLVSGEDKTGWLRYSAGQKAGMYGFMGGLLGGLIGVISGALSHKKYYINRDAGNLMHLKTTLLERVYMAPRN